MAAFVGDPVKRGLERFNWATALLMKRDIPVPENTEPSSESPPKLAMNPLTPTPTKLLFWMTAKFPLDGDPNELLVFPALKVLPISSPTPGTGEAPKPGSMVNPWPLRSWHPYRFIVPRMTGVVANRILQPSLAAKLLIFVPHCVVRLDCPMLEVA